MGVCRLRLPTNWAGFCVLQAGDARLTDTRQDEQDRCITIKSTGVGLIILIGTVSALDPGSLASSGMSACAEHPEMLPLQESLCTTRWTRPSSRA